MFLTDVTVRNAKPKGKPFKLSDGGGLFLWVQPSGGKWWRYKYRFAGKEKLLAIGAYPDVSLAGARKRHAIARQTLADGADPGEAKKEAKRQLLLKSENTFESIAREWYEQRKHKWVTSYSASMMLRLERHIFPKLGPRPITAISAPEILAILRVIEKSGALDLTRRMRQTCGQIFMYAIATGRAENNPVRDLHGALKTAVYNHHAYLKAVDLPEYLQKLEAYDGSLQTKLALRLLILTFVRTTELRAAQWTEINFDKAEWRIPAERMKMKELHIVPLSHQAIAALQKLKEKKTSDQVYVFPNENNLSTFMSENTMLYALYRMGYHSRATGHGFRSTASTILNEHGFAPDVVERQLAHGERNKVRAAYNHAQYLPERQRMMQWWADHLDDEAKKPVESKN